MKNNEYLIFNVKKSENILEAVTSLLLNNVVSRSPQCVTRCKPWGDSIKAQRAFKEFLQKARTEAATPDYQMYKTNCEKYLDFFTYSQRCGYGVLTFLHNRLA